MSSHLVFQRAALAPLLFALLGAAGTALAQQTPAAVATPPLPLVGPGAPVAPTAQQLQEMRRTVAPRARMLGEPWDGYFVDIGSREAVRLFHDTIYASSRNVPSGWVGDVSNCIAGATSVDYQQATLRRINWFRAMAGVPANVALDDGFSFRAQQAALIMSASSQLSHDPQQSWRCYTPEGAEGARRSNLALGQSGPRAVADGYMHDYGPGNAALGHRRWVLYPQTRNMGLGDVAPEGQGGAMPANALWVQDAHYQDLRPAVRDDFVAWPPRGYVPWSQVYPRWSLSYPQADFSRASVRMTEIGREIATRLEPIANGYGENTLAWLPGNYRDGMAWSRPQQDMVYGVQVDNVLVAGQPRSFHYDVIVFDPATGPALAAPQGPGLLAAGQASDYVLTASVYGAALQWRTVQLGAPETLQENVETGPARWVADTSPGYDAVAGDVAASGAGAFHLAHPVWRDQVLEWRELVVPGPGAQLSFASRLGLATPSQVALVELSQDGGATWQELYRQAGQGLNQLERGFTRRNIALGAYADRTIQLRWRYAVEGSEGFYPQVSAGTGWYIDDIELSGAQRVMQASEPAMVNAGSFRFAPQAGGQLLLQGRQGLYGHYAGWGAGVRVDVVGAALPTIAARTECVMNWAEAILPELLSPPTATRTDLPGLRYRLYTASQTSLSVSEVDGHVYFQDAPTSQPQDLGELAYWAAQAACP